MHRDRCEHRVGVSVGVTLCDETTTPDAALAAADAAMYEVKATRRSPAVEPHEPAHVDR